MKGWSLLELKKNYKDILKKNNLKNTKHRNSVMEIIEYNLQPITAEEIFIQLRERGVAISISTVYRILETLVNNKLLIKSSLSDSNKALFEIAGKKHKHHFFCVKCKKMTAVDECPIQKYQKTLEEKLGFFVKGHKLEIYGYCKSCNSENVQKQG